MAISLTKQIPKLCIQVLHTFIFKQPKYVISRFKTYMHAKYDNLEVNDHIMYQISWISSYACQKSCEGVINTCSMQLSPKQHFCMFDIKTETWEHSTCASLHLVINNIIERNHRHQNFNILYNEYLLNDIRSYVLVRGVINKNNFYRSRFVSTLYYSQGISPSRNLV